MGSKYVAKGYKLWRPTYRYDTPEGVARRVEKNGGLVLKMVGKFWGYPGGRAPLDRIGQDAAVQEGMLALWRAADAYDPSRLSPYTGRPVAFSTYACTAIGRALQQLARKGRHRWEAKWFSGQWRPAYSPERPRVVPLPRARVNAEAPRRFGPDWTDLDLPDRNAADPAEEALRLDGPAPDSARLRDAVASLPGRLREVLEARVYGGETLVEVGERLGVSKERARQLQAAAVHRLKKELVPGARGRGPAESVPAAKE